MLEVVVNVANVSNVVNVASVTRDTSVANVASVASVANVATISGESLTNRKCSHPKNIGTSVKSYQREYSRFLGYSQQSIFC